MPRQREWTERDLSLLRELYEVREMTKGQIMQKYFDGNMKYGSKRLYILRDEGLVTSQVHGFGSGDKRTRAAYYRLTEQGLHLLREKEVISETSYRARDLELTVQQRQYIIDANELHIRIPNVTYLDSRAIKRKYKLNRGNLTVGGFTYEDGDYMIFILNADSKEQTLIRILMEIRAQKPVGGYLIYYKSLAVKRQFEAISEKQALVTGGVPVYLLPFDSFGIGITREYILSNAFLKLQQLLQGYGKLTTVKSPNKFSFRYGIRQGDPSTDPYVIELITGDILILKRCLRNYSREMSQREGRRVLLFCLETDIERYKQELSSAAHVDIVGISRVSIERSFERGDS